jgi:hypothetical protein
MSGENIGDHGDPPMTPPPSTSTAQKNESLLAAPISLATQMRIARKQEREKEEENRLREVEEALVGTTLPSDFPNVSDPQGTEVPTDYDVRRHHNVTADLTKSPAAQRQGDLTADLSAINDDDVLSESQLQEAVTAAIDILSTPPAKTTGADAKLFAKSEFLASAIKDNRQNEENAKSTDEQIFDLMSEFLRWFEKSSVRNDEALLAQRVREWKKQVEMQGPDALARVLTLIVIEAGILCDEYGESKIQLQHEVLNGKRHVLDLQLKLNNSKAEFRATDDKRIEFERQAYQLALALQQMSRNQRQAPAATYSASHTDGQDGRIQSLTAELKCKAEQLSELTSNFRNADDRHQRDLARLYEDIDKYRADNDQLRQENERLRGMGGPPANAVQCRTPANGLAGGLALQSPKWQLPKFKGEKSSDPLDFSGAFKHWLTTNKHMIEQLAAPVARCQAILQQLDGTAKVYVSTLTADVLYDYDKLCDALTRQFPPLMAGTDLAVHVEQLKQNGDEDFVEFLNRFNRAYSVLAPWAGVQPLSEELKAHKLYRALLPRFQKYIANKKPMKLNATDFVTYPEISYAELITECTAYASLYPVKKDNKEAEGSGSKNSKNGNNNKNGKSKGNSNAEKADGDAEAGKEKSTQGKGGKYRNVTCYNCNEVGHISPMCKKPKKEEGADNNNNTSSPAQNSKSPQQQQQSKNAKAKARRAKAKANAEDDEDDSSNDVDSTLAQSANGNVANARRVTLKRGARQNFRHCAWALPNAHAQKC